MPPPIDLSAAFNRLVSMVSKDMKEVGENIKQIVAKITQQDSRLLALERRVGTGQMGQAPGQHGTTQVVNGQVVPGPEAVPDGTRVFNGDPNAFYKGADNDE